MNQTKCPHCSFTQNRGQVFFGLSLVVTMSGGVVKGSTQQKDQEYLDVSLFDNLDRDPDISRQMGMISTIRMIYLCDLDDRV